MTTTPQDPVLDSLTDAPSYDREFLGKQVIAKVVSVYDGDTITAIFRLNPASPPLKYSVRLTGIDTPEMKPLKTVPNREALIALAKSARDFIISRTTGQLVMLDLQGLDKYGRVLARVYLTPTPDPTYCINDMLIQAGLAKPYAGGSKSTWSV
jgi:endonuclease YncB( thermonuclease family)